MALSDDLNRLAAEDVVYLRKAVPGGPAEVFRGRLRQAGNGNWLFKTSTGQNGVIGFELGQVGAMSNWSSSESPNAGIQVFISYLVPPADPNGVPTRGDNALLTNVIPSVFIE